MAELNLRYIEQPTASQIERYAAIAHEAFIMPTERITARLAATPGTARVIAVGDDVAGGLWALDDGQYFGGRELATRGIVLVAVAPHYRGRSQTAGVGRTLMQNALREAYRAGLPLMTLFASTPAFYRRLGFDAAGQLIHWQAPLHKLPVERTDAIIEPIDPANITDELDAYRRAVGDANGPLSLRHPEFHRRVFQPDHLEVRPYRIRFGSDIEGYLVPEVNRSEGVQRIWRQAIATRRAAQAALAFLGEYRTLCQQINWIGGPADPLRLLIDANAKLGSMEEWYLRIVNVESALRGRGYPRVHCELHFDVTDEIIPENTGRYVLTIRNGQPTVQRGGSGRIALDVRTLAAIFSSHFSPLDLHRIGRLTAPADDLAALTSAFAGSQPYLLDFF